MAESITGTILWFLMFFVFAFFYPRLMLSQMIWKLEDATRRMEILSNKAKLLIWKKTKKNRKVLKRISRFMDFIVIQPSNLDPFGIVKRIDHIIRTSDKRFEEFSNQIGKGLSDKEIKRINYGLRGGMSVHQIAKVMRHYVELVKKYKNLQIALLIQMQLPIIESLIKSEFEGTKAFLNGWPVGDSIGPLVAASQMKKPRELVKNIVYDVREIDGRKVIFMKASGPEPELGRIDEGVKSILKKHKVHRVLTVDAGVKLEGEKTGTVAEGVGFAMGGIAEREIIENMLVKKKIPIDSIVIKMSVEEAISPMKKEIFKSINDVEDYIKESIKRIPKNGTLLVIGVGNTVGVGNDYKSVKKVEKIVKKLNRKTKKKSRWW